LARPARRPRTRSIGPDVDVGELQALDQFGRADHACTAGGSSGADTPACVGGNNLAIRGAVLANGADRPHVITQVTEHPADGSP
jgi:hypothetical protein